MDAQGALSQSSPCCLTASTMHWKASRDRSDAHSAFGCKNDLAKWDTVTLHSFGSAGETGQCSAFSCWHEFCAHTHTPASVPADQLCAYHTMVNTLVWVSEWTANVNWKLSTIFIRRWQILMGYCRFRFVYHRGVMSSMPPMMLLITPAFWDAW